MLRLIENKNGYWKLWENPEVGEHYVIGGDPATGLEHGDYSVLHVARTHTKVGGRRIRKFSQVAEFHGHIAADLFGHETVKTAKYFNDAYVVVEVNTVLTDMEIISSGCKNVYFRTDFESLERKTTMRPGWMTTTRTKRKAVDDFIAGLANGDIDIRSRDCIEEFLTFVRDEKGTPGGQFGCHDDRVMAALLAYQGYLDVSETPKVAVEDKSRIDVDYWTPGKVEVSWQTL